MTKYGPRRFFATTGILLILATALAGCASFNAKTWNDFTPKDKATFLNGMYSQEYEAYMADAKRPDLTEQERVVMRAKKKVFFQVHPLLELYSQYADKGQIPPGGLETQIFRLLAEVKGAIR